MYQMLEGMGDPPSGDPARRAQVGLISPNGRV